MEKSTVTFNETTPFHEPPPIHDDVLQAIFSHVPLVQLLPTSLVSKSWNDAVSSAFRMSNIHTSWLILHTQSSMYPYPTTTHAYDPTSKMWIKILRPPIDYFTTLRSSHSNLLYMMSPSKLSFSFDPLHLTWHHAPGPRVWRVDPVVAVVGDHLVVAGGVCDFENDPLAVEVYDLRSQEWTKYEPMPEGLNESAASVWLSVASDDHRLFVMEKSSGVTHLFVRNDNTWSGPYDVHPDRCIFYSVIGFSNDRLILIGMLGDDKDFDGVKVWQVNCETFECDEIGEMPAILVENLKGNNSRVSSLDVSMAGDIAYMYVSSQAEEVIACTFIVSGGCEWCSVKNTVGIDRIMMDELVFTCSEVGMEELQRAARLENCRFVVKR